ncbi:MAG: hypothetical protein ABIQ16_16580, partial [Polyangiaceae bacterium]
MKVVWLFAALLPCCKGPDFTAPSRIDSVRVLASRADLPYAAPGTSVNIDALAVDGRADPAQPMNVYFLPSPCFDPPGDAYYGCFSGFARQFRRDVDLGSVLSPGSAFQFRIPDDLIDARSRVAGQDDFGVSYVFFVACAGHVEYRPEEAGASADSVPIGCFDDSGHRLGTDDFVFAYSTVYAFTERRNKNPAFDSVSYDGLVIDPVAGLDLQHCGASSLDDCPTKKFEINVPGSSQEQDPSNLAADGTVLGESLYVQYFSTGGKLTNDTTVIFDARDGRLSNTGDDFKSPLTAGEYQLWA